MLKSPILRKWQLFFEELTKAWPGLHLVLGVALVSRYLHGLLPVSAFSKSVSEILFAILIGLYIRALMGKNEHVAAGISFSMKRILRFGIILLGLRLSLQDIGATGFRPLGLIAICFLTALLLALAAGRLFKIPPRLAALIGVGTAICGNSAIVATAPVIEADEEEVSFAVATITLFGLIAVLLYPLLGHLLQLSDRSFGLWAGTAVNDTSQVVAVSAIFSDQAQNIATIIKLTRNTLMAPIIFLIGFVYHRFKNKQIDMKTLSDDRPNLGKIIPGFVIGFVVMALIRTIGVMIGVLPQHVSEPGSLKAAANVLVFLDQVSKFSILLALSAVGLNTNIENIKRIGIKPLLVGTFVAVLLSMTSLGLIVFTSLGQ
jgi:uncharacterized integral membrane protein (TIGR00698 family)